jgi:hypothetical protein
LSVLDQVADAAGQIELLVIGAGSPSFAVEADRVERVLPVDEWHGAEPVDLEQLACADRCTLEGARVLVLGLGGGRRVALRVPRELLVCRVPAAELLELPDLVRPGAPWVRAAVLTEGQPPLLVIDPSRLRPDAT